MDDILLDVRNLTVSFHTDDGAFKAVDNVSDFTGNTMLTGVTTFSLIYSRPI